MDHGRFERGLRSQFFTEKVRSVKYYMFTKLRKIQILFKSYKSLKILKVVRNVTIGHFCTQYAGHITPHNVPIFVFFRNVNCHISHGISICGNKFLASAVAQF